MNAGVRLVNRQINLCHSTSSTIVTVASLTPTTTIYFYSPVEYWIVKNSKIYYVDGTDYGSTSDSIDTDHYPLRDKSYQVLPLAGGGR